MSLPIVVSVSEEVLSSVPKITTRLRWLSRNEMETLTKEVFPPACLAFGRRFCLLLQKLGETMTVLMVAGGAAQIAMPPFKPVRTMTPLYG
jgi:phosphate transport system permease protein